MLMRFPHTLVASIKVSGNTYDLFACRKIYFLESGKYIPKYFMIDGIVFD